MCDMLFTCKNLDTTAEPKVYPAPRGDRKNSSRSGSGSDHTRSAMGPSWGISEKILDLDENEAREGWREWSTPEAVNDFDLVNGMNRWG